jgi:hypothetical protein
LDIPLTNSSTAHNDSNGNLTPCAGSFESSEETDSDTDLLTSKVFYLHRTFRDYLEQPKVWEGLLDKTKPTGFDPCAALLMAYVTELKTTTSREVGPISFRVYDLNVPGSEPYLSLMTELDRVINSHWSGEETMATGWDWSCENFCVDGAWQALESEFQTTC